MTPPDFLESDIFDAMLERVCAHSVRRSQAMCPDAVLYTDRWQEEEVRQFKAYLRAEIAKLIEQAQEFSYAYVLEWMIDWVGKRNGPIYPALSLLEDYAQDLKVKGVIKCALDRKLEGGE